MTYTIAPDLSIRTIADEIFILQRTTSTIHSFNSTGMMIWKLFQKAASFTEIVHLLSERFDVSQSVAEEDVSQFFFILEKNHLVVMKE
jgi:hypothetical protein